ncbi:MAG: ABC transporter substrate-binding protein, partial [Mycobacterium sp.]|uniref:ABC transporter substrate-binding protein n=1 Tax=Mycobacterium sp. TaxID=1785 RepID=UPI003C4D3556
MSRRCWVAVAVAAGLAVTAGGCATHSATSVSEKPGCITHFQPDVDYFPDKSAVTDATNFTLSYHDSYQLLTVKQPYPRGRPESYVLVRCGAPTPQLTGDLAHAQHIIVPVNSVYAASTTQLGMLTELNRADAITGVADGRGPAQQINAESVIAAHPGVLLTPGADDPSYAKLRDAGLAVVADAEWLEATPLGRAEWVKALAALTGTEKKANEVYAKVRRDYRAVAAKIAGVHRIPVLPGTMYQGSWSMPAGGDYAGRLILDAGGSYPWADDTSTGSLQLNFESVYANAGQAQIWLINNNWKTIDDAVAADSRYRELAAVHRGQVWSAGNDYWARGAARPDLV